MKVSVDVHHLARIEGHGNIVVRVHDGEIEEARWQVVETPRFFEVMLKGQHFTAAPLLAARICGICSISHCLTALRATERAFGVDLPPRAEQLRLLAKHAETLQSHWLHIFFLAAPDFLSCENAVEFKTRYPEELAIALRLRGLANTMCDRLAGRTTHPVSLQPGGVAVAPQAGELRLLRHQLEDSLADIEHTATLMKGFDIPDFERETEYVSLIGTNSYPFIGGRIGSSDGVERSEDDYLEMTNETVVEGNTTKWSRLSRESYAVGPLARFNNNHALLHPDAKKFAEDLGLQPLSHNPFMAHVARLVECVHLTRECISILDSLVSAESSRDMTGVTARESRGVGAVEAPRGILFHEYHYDSSGRITAANCVVPTTQNNGNIHRDLPAFVRHVLNQGVREDSRLEQLCSMLVRAYDPCVSCSVH